MIFSRAVGTFLKIYDLIWLLLWFNYCYIIHRKSTLFFKVVDKHLFTTHIKRN